MSSPRRVHTTRLVIAAALVFGVVAVVAEIGTLARWVGVLAAVVVVTVNAWALARREERRIHALGDRVESAVSEAGGGIIRRAGDDLDRLARAISALIRVAEAERTTGAKVGQELSVVLATLDEGVAIVDQTGEYVLTNEVARSMLGSGGTIPSPRPPASLRRLLADVRNGATTASEVFEHRRPPRWLRATARPIDADRVLIVLRDVTTSRQVAAMRTDFVADASHELKTPVAALLAASETIQTALPDDPDTATMFADRLHTEALRLVSLVSDLLDLSRLESEIPVMEVVDLAQIARNEIEKRQAAFADAGIGLVSRLSEVSVQGDPGEITLAIGNLLDNARVYSSAGSVVRVEVSTSDKEALLSIIDQGSGIPARDIPRIFERFYRVDTARSRSSGGTGLGLAIVKHVVERHGGRIEVESALGVGSAFRLWFPLYS